MRLIDADALAEGYKHMGYDPTEHPEESYMEGWCKGFNAAVDHCLHHVIHAHTIELEQKWIPCSERLPKMGQPVIDNYVSLNWLSFCSDGKEWVFQRPGEIISWLPLPEPYREKGEQDALNKSEKARQETQGVWLKISPAGIYECSECHQHVMTNDITSYRFCHGCGLRMSTRIES